MIESILRLLLDLGADAVADILRRGAAGTEHAARVADMLPADPRALLTDEERAALAELELRVTGFDQNGTATLRSVRRPPHRSGDTLDDLAARPTPRTTGDADDPVGPEADRVAPAEIACGVTLPDILTRCANPQPCPIHGPTAFGARSTPPEPPPQKG